MAPHASASRGDGDRTNNAVSTMAAPQRTISQHNRRAAKLAQARRGSVHLDSESDNDEASDEEGRTEAHHAHANLTANTMAAAHASRSKRNPVPVKTLSQAQFAQRAARHAQKKRGSTHL
jgi:hypothetical protein